MAGAMLRLSRSLLSSSATLASVRTSGAAAAVWARPSQLLRSRRNYETGTPEYQAMYKQSVENPDAFWADQARSLLQWQQDFAITSRNDFESGLVSWFLGGKLNASENCVDRHAFKDPNKVALIWESDDPNHCEKITYKKLLSEVCRLANALKTRGVRKGDSVCLYMPMTPYAVYAMLACARIGAPHSIVFAGFSAEALHSRINNSNCKYVITADQGVRGGRHIPLKDTTDIALTRCPQVKNVFVQKRTGARVNMVEGRDLYLEDAMAKEAPYCPPERMDAEDPLFLLYTSGSTGAPKGLMHSTGGYLTYAALTHKYVFDYRPGDVHACVADVGWITGHTYVVYGPLLNGATTVLFEGVPTHPDASRYWDLVEKHKVTQFYTAPTALRMLIKSGNDFVKKHNRSSLRVLGSVGEPINPEAWKWYHDVVGEGRCNIVDTWWQTETGGIMITTLGTDKPGKPGAAMRPFFGVEPAIVNEDGSENTAKDAQGILCIKNATPGMARTVFGDHERYLDVYFKPHPGYYFSGDGAWRDEDGDIWITGRVDDVVKVSGHRLSTANVESALVSDTRVAEAAVVGYPHDLKGEGVYAYVILKNGVEVTPTTEKELKQVVRAEIGAFAQPDHVLVVSGLPKTRSGKIMRRILRKIASNKFTDLGDISTLSEPAIVDEIIQKHKGNAKSHKHH